MWNYSYKLFLPGGCGRDRLWSYCNRCRRNYRLQTSMLIFKPYSMSRIGTDVNLWYSYSVLTIRPLKKGYKGINQSFFGRFDRVQVVKTLTLINRTKKTSWFSPFTMCPPAGGYPGAPAGGYPGAPAGGYPGAPAAGGYPGGTAGFPGTSGSEVAAPPLSSWPPKIPSFQLMPSSQIYV